MIRIRKCDGHAIPMREKTGNRPKLAPSRDFFVGSLLRQLGGKLQHVYPHRPHATLKGKRFLSANTEKFRSSPMLAAVQKSIARHFSPFISRTERVNNSAAGAEMGGEDDTHRFKNLPSRVINKLSLYSPCRG